MEQEKTMSIEERLAELERTVDRHEDEIDMGVAALTHRLAHVERSMPEGFKPMLGDPLRNALRAARASSGAAGRDENGCSSPVEQPIPNRQEAGSTPAPVATPSPSAMPTKETLALLLLNAIQRVKQRPQFATLTECPWPGPRSDALIQADAALALLSPHVARIERERDGWQSMYWGRVNMLDAARQEASNLRSERDAATARAEAAEAKLARLTEERDQYRDEWSRRGEAEHARLRAEATKLRAELEVTRTHLRECAEAATGKPWTGHDADAATVIGHKLRSAPPSAAIDVEACVQALYDGCRHIERSPGMVTHKAKMMTHDEIRAILSKHLRASPRAPGVTLPNTVPSPSRREDNRQAYDWALGWNACRDKVVLLNPSTTFVPEPQQPDPPRAGDAPGTTRVHLTEAEIAATFSPERVAQSRAELDRGEYVGIEGLTPPPAAAGEKAISEPLSDEELGYQILNGLRGERFEPDASTTYHARVAQRARALLAPHAAAKTWKPLTWRDLADALNPTGAFHCAADCEADEQRELSKIADALNAARKDG